MRFIDEQEDSGHVVMLHGGCTHGHTIPYFGERTVAINTGRQMRASSRFKPCAWLECVGETPVP